MHTRRGKRIAWPRWTIAAFARTWTPVRQGCRRWSRMCRGHASAASCLLHGRELGAAQAPQGCTPAPLPGKLGNQVRGAVKYTGQGLLKHCPAIRCCWVALMYSMTAQGQGLEAGACAVPGHIHMGSMGRPSAEATARRGRRVAEVGACRYLCQDLQTVCTVCKQPLQLPQMQPYVAAGLCRSSSGDLWLPLQPIQSTCSPSMQQPWSAEAQVGACLCSSQCGTKQGHWLNSGPRAA